MMICSKRRLLKKAPPKRAWKRSQDNTAIPLPGHGGTYLPPTPPHHMTQFPLH